METQIEKNMDTIIEQFKKYSISHPNLSDCWISYLEPKKRHYDETIEKQCNYVLSMLENGYNDLNKKYILTLLIYKQSLI